MPHDDTGRGVLFKNNNQREGKRDPDYSGHINIAGVDYWLSGWVNEAGPSARNPGSKFLSLQLGNQKSARSPQETTPQPTGDDDIPF